MIAAIVLLASGCNRDKLVPLQAFHVEDDPAPPPTATVHADFCTRPSELHYEDTKFIFVFDKSGSNQVNYAPDNINPPYIPLTGTDENGQQRYGSAMTFLNSPELKNTPGNYYSLISFNTTTALTQPFTSDLDAFKKVVMNEWQQASCLSDPTNPNSAPIAGCHSNDGNWTDYQDTLATLQQLIQADAQQSGTKLYHYVILWISDGAPWMPQNTPPYEFLQPQSQIIGPNQPGPPSVASIVALQQQYSGVISSIQFNTAYYHFSNGDNGFTSDYDPVADALMAQMAKVGGGAHFEISDGQAVNLSDFPIYSTLVKYSFEDFIAHNYNTVWYNGNLELDSDGDGLADVQEIQLGSNPNAYDSDGNGVGDGVEYFQKGTPCNDANCSPQLARSFPMCNSLQKPNGSTAGDRLTDCEMAVLGMDYTSPTAPNTWMPVSLLVEFGLAPTTASTTLPLDSNQSGYTNYQDIKLNLPITQPANAVVPMPYQYSVNMTSSDTNQSCYHADITNIPTIGKGNQIALYLLESSLGESQRFLRLAEKKLDGNDSVTFSNSDFVIPGE
jgi:hypothetical protein